MGNPLCGVFVSLFLQFFNPTLLNTDYQATPHVLDKSMTYLFSYPKT